MTALADPTSLATPAVVAATPTLSAAGIGKVINGRHALADVSLSIAGGESVALIGANGAGKSTLLRIFATLIPPTRGSLHLFGEPAAGRAAPLRSRIGMIAHQLMLYADLSALENLELFGRLYAVRHVAERAMELLDFFGMADRARDPVRSLSRGMAQRVAIARALMHEPDLLLADEPFTGLDQASSARLVECFSELRADGSTVVIAHHDFRHAASLCARTLVLAEGRLVIDSPSSTLDERDVLMAMGGGG